VLFIAPVSMSKARVIAALIFEQIVLQRTSHSINMNIGPQQVKAVVPAAPSTRYTGEASRHSRAVKSRLEEEPIWNPESQFPAPVAVLQLVTGRWVANIVGLAAELGLADLIQTGPKTAEEVAAANGLHAPSLGRERTRSEWQKLLSAGGFRFLRAVPTSSSVHALRD
jgi:hypothetical protein